LEVGNSLVESDRFDMARELLGRGGDKLVLPRGVTVAKELSSEAEIKDVRPDEIGPDWAVYDIDENAADQYTKRITAAKTVVWNGPMGVFETPPFDAGTVAIARGLAAATARGATTIVGGGDSAAAVAKAGLTAKVSHVSTGGGASLELLEGKELPGVAALDEL
jgi:phosphoglycerate kinase